MKLKIFLIALLLQSFLFFEIKAQFNTLDGPLLLPKSKYNYGLPLIIKLPEKKILVFSQEDQWGNVLTFRHYNENLEEEWMCKPVLPVSHAIKSFYYDKKKSLYIISQSSNIKEISLAKINVENGAQKIIKTNLPLFADVLQVKILEDFAFIVVYHKAKMILLRLDLTTTKIRVLPYIYDREYKFISYHKDAYSNLMYFLMKNEHNCNLQLRTYSQVLGFLPALDLEFRDDYTFIEGLVYPVSKDKKLIFSAFSLRCNDRTQGIAVTKINNQTEKPITAYYRFTNYMNYFEHFREKRAERYRERVRKRRAKGKEYRLRNYTLLQEKAKKINDEIILVAEGYSMEYQSIGEGERIFDGYKTYHATVIGFNEKGEKLWDNGIKVRNINEKRLDEIIQVGNYQDSVVLAYIADDILHSKMIHRYSVVKEETEQPLKDLLDNPKLSTYTHEMIHWYDNIFLVWGVYYANTQGTPVYYLQKMEYIPTPDLVENN